MRPSSLHCEPSRLGRLLSNSLPEHEEADVIRHLDTCSSCQKALERLAAESRLWGLARRIADLEDPAGLTEEVEWEGLGSDGSGDPRGEEIALDFLAPTDKPGVLGMLGTYEIHGVLGQGGMGLVFEAYDPRLCRPVAIKVLAPCLAAGATARRRFAREARATAAIVHDHIVSIHAVEASAGLPYLVMQLVAGRSLQERIDGTGPLELKEVLRIGHQAALGLAAAHAQGVIHRDIKPANILLENGLERVKITDFGLARVLDDATLTQSGVVTGTPQYMAPEQAKGERIDHRADLFSLGSVLYAMCTGRSPFRAETTLAVLRRVAEDDPRPIRELNPDVPGWLEAIVARLLAKDPAGRYQSAGEVAELLGRWLAHIQEPEVNPPPSDPRTRPDSTRRDLRRALAAAALIAAFAALGTTEATGVTQVAETVATVLRIRTPEGTLRVEVGDPQVKVSVDGREVVISGAGAQEIRLRPGFHEVRARRPGEPERAEIVEVTRGGKALVKITEEADAPRATQGADAKGPTSRERLRASVLAAEHELARAARGAHGPEGPTVADLKARIKVLEARLRDLTIREAPPRAPGTSPPPAGAVGTIVVMDSSGRTIPLRVPSGPGQPAPASLPARPGAKAPKAVLRGPEGRRIWTLAFSPDGKYLATGSGVPEPGLQGFGDDPGEFALWDLQTSRLRLTLGQKHVVRSVAFSPDGKLIATAGFEPSVRVREIGTGKTPQTIRVPAGGANAVAFSPDGRTLATGGVDSAVRLWDLDSGELRGTLDAGAGSIVSLAFFPDGRSLVAGGEDANARIWDLETGKVRVVLRGHERIVEFVAVSPDGTLVASSGGDRSIKLWDTRDGDEVVTLAGHREPVLGVAFSPDGRTLASCSGTSGSTRAGGGSGEEKLWDLTTHTERLTLRSHCERSSAIAFSPDGRTLATAGWDGMVNLWEVGEPDGAK